MKNIESRELVNNHVNPTIVETMSKMQEALDVYEPVVVGRDNSSKVVEAYDNILKAFMTLGEALGEEVMLSMGR